MEERLQRSHNPLGGQSASHSGTPRRPVPQRLARSAIVATRERLGLTQAQLALKLDVNRVTVARWESGERRPQLKYMRRLAQLAGEP